MTLDELINKYSPLFAEYGVSIDANGNLSNPQNLSNPSAAELVAQFNNEKATIEKTTAPTTPVAPTTAFGVETETPVEGTNISAQTPTNTGTTVSPTYTPDMTAMNFNFNKPNGLQSVAVDPATNQVSFTRSDNLASQFLLGAASVFVALKSLKGIGRLVQGKPFFAQGASKVGTFTNVIGTTKISSFTKKAVGDWKTSWTSTKTNVEKTQAALKSVAPDSPEAAKLLEQLTAYEKFRSMTGFVGTARRFGGAPTRTAIGVAGMGANAAPVVGATLGGGQLAWNWFNELNSDEQFAVAVDIMKEAAFYGDVEMLEAFEPVLVGDENTIENAENILMYNIMKREAIKANAANTDMVRWAPSGTAQMPLTDTAIDYLVTTYDPDRDGQVENTQMIQDIETIQSNLQAQQTVFLQETNADGSFKAGYRIDAYTYNQAVDNFAKSNGATKPFALLDVATQEQIKTDFTLSTDFQSLKESNILSSEKAYAAAQTLDTFEKTFGWSLLDTRIKDGNVYQIVNGQEVFRFANGTEEANSIQQAYSFYESDRVTYQEAAGKLTPEGAAAAAAATSELTTEAENQWFEYIMEYDYQNGSPLDENSARLKAKEMAANGFDAAKASAWRTTQRAQDADSLIGLYPQWTDAIKAGADVRGLASSWIKVLGTIYGVDTNAVDLNDPLLAPAISVINEKGKAMNLQEYSSWLRKQEAYYGTEEAASKYTNLAESLRQTFGI